MGIYNTQSAIAREVKTYRPCCCVDRRTVPVLGQMQREFGTQKKHRSNRGTSSTPAVGVFVFVRRCALNLGRNVLTL